MLALIRELTTSPGVNYLYPFSGRIAISPVRGFIKAVNPEVVHGVAIYPAFARPCPTRPRHGFVDSRVITSKEELIKLAEETLTADPDGEIMLCPPIIADLNGIWTPSLLTIGKGHDGATSGKNTLNFPLAGTPYQPSTIDLKMDASIGAGEMPYIEVVTRGQQCWLTQLRAGPKLEGSSVDYCPKTTLVKKVVKVDSNASLLEWEKLIQSLDGEEGVVIDHPGGSPTDHFAVHARTFNIPVMITKRVSEGDTIEAIKKAPYDPEGVLRGVAFGDALYYTYSAGANSYRQLCELMLLIFHNSSEMVGDHSWWLGLGASIMMRLGGMALKGEARHINSIKGERSAVYVRVANHNLTRMRASLGGVIHTLRYGSFGGAVGGIKWAMCGQATSDLFDAVGMLARGKSEVDVQRLVRVFNVAVNQAHNGGWWLNKFVAPTMFTLAQNGSPFLPIACMQSIADVAGKWDGRDEGVLTKRIDRYAQWPLVDLSPLPLTSAEVMIVPGINGLQLDVRDRMLKTKHRPIVVGVEHILAKLNAITRGKLVVSTTKSGLELSFVTPHEEPVLIWKEDGIPRN